MNSKELPHAHKAVHGPHKSGGVALAGNAPAGRNGAAPHEEDLQEAFHQAQANLLRYQELFDFAPVGYLVTDAQGVIQEANHAVAAMLGSRKGFLQGVPLLFFVSQSDRRSFSVKLVRLGYSSDEPSPWVLKLAPHRAAPLDVLVTISVSTNRDQPPVLRWALRDITRQNQAEEDFQAEREFTESLVELAEAINVVLDGAGRIVRANPYLYSLTGHARCQLTGWLLTDLVVGEDRASLEQELGRLNGGNKVHGTFRLRTQDKQTRTIAWSARNLTADPLREAKTLLVGNDITELQEAQGRALRAERLAAIGEMIAGLSHESRNALQRSQACLSILSYRLQGQPEALDLVERVQKAQDDLHRLYESVREYAAPIHLEMKSCKLANLWREAWEDLAQVRDGHQAELREEIRVSDLHCECSPFHFKGVFRNLLENALSAIRGPVRVVIRCTPAEIDGREAIRIAVADNGPGFSAEARSRAFEPFFTTRVRGTGLGLPICRRLVEAHGGRIALGEEEGKGAVVLVTVPRAAGEKRV